MPVLEPGPAGQRTPSQASTAVPLARSEDIARRRRVYTIQMAVRLLCFLALPFLPGWWKLIALVGAVVLPYIAVLMANDPNLDAGREQPLPSAPGPRELSPSHGDSRRPASVIRVDDDGEVRYVHGVSADPPADRTTPDTGPHRPDAGPGPGQDRPGQRATPGDRS